MVPLAQFMLPVMAKSPAPLMVPPASCNVPAPTVLGALSVKVPEVCRSVALAASTLSEETLIGEFSVTVYDPPAASMTALYVAPTGLPLLGNNGAVDHFAASVHDPLTGFTQLATV
jgi:hypothetical protein